MGKGGREEYGHYLSSMANTNPKLIRGNWDEYFWHGHNVVTLFLHCSRAPLPGSEVEAQPHTASTLPKVICKITKQESGRPGMRFGCKPISWLIYSLEENYLKQTDCLLRHWRGEKSSHDTTPCISRGKGNRTVYAGRVMKEAGQWNIKPHPCASVLRLPIGWSSLLPGIMVFSRNKPLKSYQQTTTINN